MALQMNTKKLDRSVSASVFFSSLFESGDICRYYLDKLGVSEIILTLIRQTFIIYNDKLSDNHVSILKYSIPKQYDKLL